MQAKLLALVTLLLATSIFAANICDFTVANYASYSYGYNCESGNNNYVNINNVTSTNKVLKKLLTGSYSYVDFSSIIVGDTLKTIAGDTLVLSMQPSFIAAPEILNGENYLAARNNPAYKQVSTWVGLDGATILPHMKTGTKITVTQNGDIYTYKRDYNEFLIEQQTTILATNRYNPALQVDQGPIYCHETLHELISYDSQSLLAPVFGDNFQDIKLVGRLSEFAEMTQSILSTAGNLLFVNEATLYDFSIDVPSCESHEVVTENGYITINGVSFRTH
jgi:hypothetical protein